MLGYSILSSVTASVRGILASALSLHPRETRIFRSKGLAFSLVPVRCVTSR